MHNAGQSYKNSFRIVGALSKDSYKDICNYASPFDQIYSRHGTDSCQDIISQRI